jgi:peptidyl-prolyl cis-trans isomerase C
VTKLLFQTIHKDQPMQLIKSGLLLASAASLFLIGACSADKDAKSATPASKEPIAATVNGSPISQKTVDMLVNKGVGSGHPDTPESRKAIIDRLALQAVIAQAERDEAAGCAQGQGQD